MNEKENKSTESVHGGETKFKHMGSLTNPIFQTSTYAFESTSQLRDFMEGRLDREEEYGRYGNPTMDAAQRKLAELDHAQRALLFSSGMNAVCTTLFALLEQGMHIIITNDSYRRTRQFIRDVLSRYGVEFTLVEPTAEAIEKAVQPNTELVISESPTNPYLRVLDFPEFVGVCKKHNLVSVIDSTLATPFNQRVLDYGVDLVIHSATKYLGGHNDLLAGVVTGNSDYHMDNLKQFRDIMGGVVDPNSSYLLIRGMKTLALRMERHNSNALAIARFLESHPKVDRVHYPGLKSHIDHQIAKEQMAGFGGLLSFEIKGDLESCSRFIDSVRVPFLAPSIGGVESLIEQVCLVSYYDLTTEERLAVGIKENLVRFSVGIEDPEDLIADLNQALNKI